MSKRSPSLNLLLLFVVLSLIAFNGACKKKAAETVPEAPAEAAAAQPAPPPSAPAQPDTVEVERDFPGEQPFGEGEPSVEELNERGVLATVYFEFDKSDLSDETRATLRRNAEWLKSNPQYRIVIEGHCDERGTIEYNLALGQRRANAVREYLVSQALPANRMRVVSYGEERPAKLGHDEETWKWNRRAEFVIE